MNDQYYTADPTSESKPVPCEFSWRSCELSFLTDAGVFSKGRLDEGTELMMNALPDKLSGDVLDLGCGWGPIGISLKKQWPDINITMGDVNHRALKLTADNARRNGVSVSCVESDGMAAFIGNKYDVIITNPPIRAGKQVIYKMFADSAACLKENGCLYLVIRKQQGAESAVKYLKTLFAEVERLSRNNGFWVLRASSPIV